jgi:hypothetical protein
VLSSHDSDGAIDEPTGEPLEYSLPLIRSERRAGRDVED